MSRDFAIFATEIYQRLPFLHFRVLHFPDKNRVVAGNVRGNHIATHLEKRAIDDGGAAGRSPKMDAQPLLRFGAVFAFCEVFGDGLLILFQDAEAELFFLLKQRMHICAVVDTNENQHGIERNGCERVGGHAVNFARLALDGDHGNAGGEMAQGFAEFG